MITVDKTQFETNLQITQAYCEQQLHYREKNKWAILRSSINPVWQEGEWYAHMPNHEANGSVKQSIVWKEWTEKTNPYYSDSFTELFDKQLAYKKKLIDEARHDRLYLGRILVIEYGMNIPDGVVEVETESFFDEFDLPPIDTWFYKGYSNATGGILFAWISEKFLALTDEAIDMQFLSILHWFPS